ncbi:hypothetical protein LCGC14_0898460 [marine sediment metagenome]|uniref:Uncharacterized protein n=1 Tax=marine sediment metagenome TaxID=412755 RepID=A0A0F9NX20_9ZZZZ
MTDTTAVVQEPQQMLRWLADNYEQAQRLRIQVGERIRATLQGRDRTELDKPTVVEEMSPEEKEDFEAAEKKRIDGTMLRIRSGKDPGPVPILGRSYNRYWTEERDTYKDMMAALEGHPVFHWISRVRGCGPTLACKILARFDPLLAPYDSSFWKYAGLSTVPGKMYRCTTCNLERGFPVSYNITGGHKRLGTEANCKGQLELVEDADIRVAQPRAEHGQKRSYDAYAKKTLWLLSQQWVKGGGAYGDFYRRMKDKVVEEKPGWAKGRQNYWALRKAQKLFLSHLWRVWREALGLPTPMPYAYAVMEHDEAGYIDPWDFVEPEE